MAWRRSFSWEVSKRESVIEEDIDVCLGSIERDYSPRDVIVQLTSPRRSPDAFISTTMSKRKVAYYYDSKPLSTLCALS